MHNDPGYNDNFVNPMKLIPCFTIIVCLSFLACAPKAIVSLSSSQDPVKDYEGFVIFEKDEIIDSTAMEIGTIKIGDAIFTVNCNYEAVLQLASSEARKMGANCLQIIEHKLPNPLGSTCHRIKAVAYRVADITPYEIEIAWHPERKLKKADFKGSIANRPFQAATASSVSYMYQGRIIDGHVVVSVSSTFRCLDSYFKDSPYDKETLAHEQGHFDITEIHARKLLKAFKDEIKDVKDLESRGNTIYNRIGHDWQLMQDAYDSAVYGDPVSQIFWLEKIKQDLQALNAFEKKEINVPFNAK